MKKTTKATTAKRWPAWSVATLAAQAPAGWTSDYGTGWADCYGGIVAPKEAGQPGVTYVRFMFAEGDLKVTLALSVTAPQRGAAGRWEREHAWHGKTVEGHTTYNGRCFTRTGVDVSSCTLTDGEGYGHGYADVATLCAGELQRCRDARARSLTMVDVPGLPGGWRVTPQGKADISAKLQAGKPHSFTPAGFGTGYCVSGRRGRMSGGGYGSEPLPAETSAFFGVRGPLYYTTLDCD